MYVAKQSKAKQSKVMKMSVLDSKCDTSGAKSECSGSDNAGLKESGDLSKAAGKAAAKLALKESRELAKLAAKESRELAKADLKAVRVLAREEGKRLRALEASALRASKSASKKKSKSVVSGLESVEGEVCGELRVESVEESDVEEIEVEEVEYSGRSYLLDRSTGRLYDEGHSEVGTWIGACPVFASS